MLVSLLLLAACDKRQETGSSPESASGLPRRETKRPRSAIEATNEKSITNPIEALNRAASIPSGIEREKALSQVAWETLENHPDVCLQALAKLDLDGAERVRLIQHIAMRRAEANSDEALKWAETLGSEKEISVAKCQIALVLAESNPLEAAGMLSASGIEGREFDVALVQVIQRWAEKSPSEAAAWAVSFKPGEARTASIREAVSRWVGKNPAAMFAWKAGLADPAIQRDIIAALAEAAAKQPDNTPPPWLDAADEETRQAVRNARP